NFRIHVAVLDDLQVLDRHTRRQVEADLKVQRIAIRELKNVTRRMTFHHRPQQRAISDKYAPRLESSPPGILGEFLVAKYIHAVRADWIVVAARAASGRRRNS